MIAQKVFALLSVICLPLVGCARTSDVDKQAEASAVRDLEAQLMAAGRAKDIDKTVHFFAPNAIVIDQNRPLVVGRESIRKYFEKAFAADSVGSDSMTTTVDTVEISASGDLAYARGRDRWLEPTPKGSLEKGYRWIDVCKKIDGKWNIIIDIGNEDILSVPEMASTQAGKGK